MPLDSPLTRQPLRLAPGVYSVGLTYINAPDYDYVHYDPYTMPAGIWEGAIAVEPIRVVVEPPPAADLARHEGLLRADAADDLTLELLTLSDAEGVSRVIAQIPQLQQTRPRILVALRRAATLPMRELVDAIRALPPRERTSLIVSTEFLWLMRDQADCELLSYLVGELDGMSAVFHGFRPMFEASSGRCPGIKASLRAVVVDPARSASGRGTAAALLGVFRDRADVPLLIDVLEQRLPTAPGVLAWHDHMLRAGVAAALGQLGGPDAIAALARALADERRNVGIAHQINQAGFGAVTGYQAPRTTRRSARR